MAFPVPADLGRVLAQMQSELRRLATARNLGWASITKGEGSLDLLPSDDATVPEASIGDLPDGSQGVGARIGGTMVNLATWAKDQVDSLSVRITAEKNRNDAQDQTLANHASTLASHNTRISAAQSKADSAASSAAAAQLTANGAVSKNSEQDGRLTALEGKPDGATQSEVQALRNRVAELESKMNLYHPTIGA